MVVSGSWYPCAYINALYLLVAYQWWSDPWWSLNHGILESILMHFKTLFYLPSVVSGSWHPLCTLRLCSLFIYLGGFWIMASLCVYKCTLRLLTVLLTLVCLWILASLCVYKCTLRLSVCLLYTSPSPRDRQKSRMPSSA